MAEQIIVTAQDKKGQYEEILPQILSVIEGETDRIANLANVAAILKETFHFFWVGFYEVKQPANHTEPLLILAPFQGPLACTRIRYNKGVCGTAWAKKTTLVVPDVEKFPGHIACSSLSRSEIVVPIVHSQTQSVVAVLDIDSQELATFDDTDRFYLEQLTKELAALW